MGIEYYLINRENKTFYELGKGQWYELNGNLDSLNDLEYLEEFIFEYCLSDFEDDKDNKEYKKQYCKEIAVEIFEFAQCKNLKNIILTSDCGDELYVIRCLGYFCVGTRYRSDTDCTLNKEYVEFENRHLKLENKIRYSLEKCSEAYCDQCGQSLLKKFSSFIE